LTEPRIAALLARIVSRGHQIGLHGSYGSAFDPLALARELAELKIAAARAGSSQTRFGARQHYLRWGTPATARALAALDLAHDSTLGFSDVAGFRCGTCHPYRLWDVQAGAALNLVERPLALMEVTVTSPDYLNLGLGAAAVDLMRDIKRRCAHFGGEFSLLWHNSNLTEPRSREIYEELIGPPPR
jgi:GNAT superfamily N-acetyltransferase